MSHPNSTALLFAGQLAAVTLRDGTTVSVRVRELPARHHLDLIELFHVGREADLIARCTERPAPPDLPSPNSDLRPVWTPVDGAFVDNLSDESHVALVDLATTLNFSRAIRTAERQIARGQQLSPVITKLTQALLEPMKRELASWTSSLTSQLSAAVAAKQP
jgi:hypothetical protein